MKNSGAKEQLTFSIADSGIGIAEDHLRNLGFEYNIINPVTSHRLEQWLGPVNKE